MKKDLQYVLNVVLKLENQIQENQKGNGSALNVSSEYLQSLNLTKNAERERQIRDKIYNGQIQIVNKYKNQLLALDKITEIKKE